METKLKLKQLAEKSSNTIEHQTSRVFIREVTAKYRGARKAGFAIDGPSRVRDFVAGVLKDNSREHFVALLLNGAHQVISYSIVSIGTANATLVHPREVFQHAILAGATAVVVAHNHPSGKLEASDEDRRVTTMLVKAGEVIGIPVLDHVIVTDDCYLSFSEKGWID